MEACLDINAMDEKENKKSSELRLNVITGDWVVMAAGRSSRPEDFVITKKPKENNNAHCPFCHLESQEKPKLIYPKNKNNQDTTKNWPDDWDVAVISNKYPAFTPGEVLNKRTIGPYQVMDGVGFQEVVITRSHHLPVAKLPLGTVKRMIDAYQERYLDLMNERLINYISIFQNHGYEAGASIIHPHSQIIAVPVFDPSLIDSIEGAKKYYQKHQQCGHCLRLKWDLKEKSRIIFENDKFVALCPFASRTAFEIKIISKDHQPYFERIKDEDKWQLAQALKTSLGALYNALNDPPYNFYIHTSPCDGKNYDYYHWHLTILPRTTRLAGFEFCTGIDVCTLDPEEAASILRKHRPL